MMPRDQKELVDDQEHLGEGIRIFIWRLQTLQEKAVALTTLRGVHEAVEVKSEMTPHSQMLVSMSTRVIFSKSGIEHPKDHTTTNAGGLHSGILVDVAVQAM